MKNILIKIKCKKYCKKLNYKYISINKNKCFYEDNNGNIHNSFYFELEDIYNCWKYYKERKEV